jgi:hypothetical protein
MKGMGVAIVENWTSSRRSAPARRLKRYEFMITFAPLPVEDWHDQVDIKA